MIVRHKDKGNVKKAMKKHETRTILIVDYDKSTCRTFKQIIQRQGYGVDMAKDGEEAIEKIRNNTYDATLINFVLPDMDGIDLLLFTNKTMPNAAKIITTGFPSLRNGIKAIESGADAYFSKPVQPKELIRVIDEKLKLQEKEKDKQKEKDNKSSNLSKSYHDGSTSFDGNGKKGLLNGLNRAC